MSQQWLLQDKQYRRVALSTALGAVSRRSDPDFFNHASHFGVIF
jgi:hypothetical protein